jgi:hypothetical protein
VQAITETKPIQPVSIPVAATAVLRKQAVEGFNYFSAGASSGWCVDALCDGEPEIAFAFFVTAICNFFCAWLIQRTKETQ